MSILNLPTVNTQFKNQTGDLFTVIARGTKGIIIEYLSGKVELISQKNWETMYASAVSQQKH